MQCMIVNSIILATNMDLEYPPQEAKFQSLGSPSKLPPQTPYLFFGKFTLRGQQCHLIINSSTIFYRVGKQECSFIISLDYCYRINKHNAGWLLKIYTWENINFLEFYTDKDISDWDYGLSRVITRYGMNDMFGKVSKLGSGVCANVHLISRNHDHHQFAVKSFNKQKIDSIPIQKLKLQSEIKKLKKFNHPNIIKFEGVFETERTIYVVTEYVKGQNLCDYLKKNQRIPAEVRRKIMQGILSGLAAMEIAGVVHRDIKPDNIMMNGYNEPKIIDFGIATETDVEEYMFVKCGTPGYVAPQIASIKDTKNARMTTKSDIFSAGAIFYQLLFGKKLFWGNKVQIMGQTLRYDGSLPALRDFSTHQQYSLLEWMLDPNPEKRISATKALEYYFPYDKYFS